MNIEYITTIAIKVISVLMGLFILLYLWERIEKIKYKQDKEYKNHTRSIVLNDSTIDTIDIYNQLGIKIPLDILEELEYNDFQDQDDIIDFIENQRIHWKYENMKKFKKDLFN